MNAFKCISNGFYNIWYKPSYSIRMIKGIIFILVILETVFLVTYSITKDYEETVNKNIINNSVTYYTTLNDDVLFSETDTEIFKQIQSIDNIGMPSCSIDVDINKKIGDDKHYFTRIDRVSLKNGSDIYNGIEDKSFDFDPVLVLGNIVRFDISIYLKDYCIVNSNFEQQFNYYYPDESLILAGRKSSSAGEIMMSSYMCEHFGITDYDDIIGKNISFEIDGKPFLSDVKLVGIINEDFFRMDSTYDLSQIILYSNENDIPKYASALDSVRFYAPIQGFKDNINVYNTIKEMGILDKAICDKASLKELTYTKQLSRVSSYILKFLCVFIILAMMLSMCSIICNHIVSEISYYGMLSAIGMQRSSLVFTFLSEQSILLVVSVIISFPVYELFVIIINKFLNDMAGVNIEFKIEQVVNIALKSSTICAVIVFVISITIFSVLLWKRDIISMLKK